jgi:hypothetical protein
MYQSTLLWLKYVTVPWAQREPRCWNPCPSNQISWTQVLPVDWLAAAPVLAETSDASTPTTKTTAARCVKDFFTG